MSHDGTAATADSLLAMPDDGKRYELVRGDLRMMSPSGGRHGRITLKLSRRIGDHVEQHRLGETYAAETGFLLQRNPDTVLAPDVAFVSRARLGGLADHPGYLPIAPDLVVEVVSPHDRSAEIEQKASAWLDAGVAVVLVVDPQAGTIRDYRPNRGVGEFFDGFVDLEGVVPGFRLDVAELFS
jgi:Uma2 family endonuclease